jgi:hypothetical protein
MRWDIQNEIFVTAWMHCLNNFSCRRLAMRILNIENVANMTFESKYFKQQINKNIQKKTGVCVVKNFGEECHWIFVSKHKEKIKFYNTSLLFDVENVKKSIKYEINDCNCNKLQKRNDCFCQTWSLVCAYAHAHNLEPCKKLFKLVVNRLLKSRLFKD